MTRTEKYAELHAALRELAERCPHLAKQCAAAREFLETAQVVYGWSPPCLPVDWEECVILDWRADDGSLLYDREFHSDGSHTLTVWDGKGGILSTQEVRCE